MVEARQTINRQKLAVFFFMGAVCVKNAELVRDKERANFCDYFSVNRAFDGGAGTGASKAESARNAFAALFGS